MSDPRNEENEYGENDAMKIADMNTQPDGDDDENPDMDDELNEDDAVPGERRQTPLPGVTAADSNEI
jgi:hypothetical protein